MKSNILFISVRINGDVVCVKYRSGTVRYFTNRSLPDTARAILIDAAKNPARYLCERITEPALSGDARTGYKYHDIAWYRFTKKAV